VTPAFRELIGTLVAGGVEFILAGGVAAVAHGAARATFDLDVVYRRTADNIDRLAATLAPLEPYLRGAPAGLPFRFDPPTISRGLNFTLTTRLGDLDLLGEIVGGGTYEALFDASDEIVIFGYRCRCLSLEALIRAKRAAGRPKDIEALAELEALREERGR
jgi:hypothetical protein